MSLITRDLLANHSSNRSNPPDLKNLNSNLCRHPHCRFTLFVRLSLLWKEPKKNTLKKRSFSMSKSLEETSGVDDEAYAAGCPSCLLYVLISRSNPKCPRCNMALPPTNMKKPRIDLNITI
ncbi:hypothetical protein SSX86_005992 [Deinandra increscens subsp. villosa]|uniref:GIR1-like zinc ribbon domain-containing protein n=1 Tax=Deinandra increscens subsp. villosa TaxID=3103831 RepID=A0AAP0HCF1_9ASTR